MYRIIRVTIHTDSESDSYNSEDRDRSGESKGGNIDSIDSTLALCPALCFEKYRVFHIHHILYCVIIICLYVLSSIAYSSVL